MWRITAKVMKLFIYDPSISHMWQLLLGQVGSFVKGFFFFFLYIYGATSFDDVIRLPQVFSFVNGWMDFYFLFFIRPQVGLDDVAYTSMEKGKSLGLEKISQFYVDVVEFDWWRKNSEFMKSDR